MKCIPLKDISVQGKDENPSDLSERFLNAPER